MCESMVVCASGVCCFERPAAPRLICWLAFRGLLPAGKHKMNITAQVIDKVVVVITRALGRHDSMHVVTKGGAAHVTEGVDTTRGDADVRMRLSRTTATLTASAAFNVMQK